MKYLIALAASFFITGPATSADYEIVEGPSAPGFNQIIPDEDVDAVSVDVAAGTVSYEIEWLLGDGSTFTASGTNQVGTFGATYAERFFSGGPGFSYVISTPDGAAIAFSRFSGRVMVLRAGENFRQGHMGSFIVR